MEPTNRINRAQLNHAQVIKFIPKNQLATIFDEAVDDYIKTRENDSAESFGALVQGFFGIKHGNECLIQPFFWMSDKQRENIKKAFMTIKCTQVGISFCKTYQHYGF
jgi:hypothetical protein